MEKVTLVGSANISKVYERLRKIDSVKDGKVDNVISREELDEARKEGVDTTIEFKEGKASSLDALQRLYIRLQELDAADGAKDGDVKELREHLGTILTKEQQNQKSVSAEIESLNKSMSFEEAMKIIDKLEGLLKENAILRFKEYKNTVAHLIQLYPNVDPFILYSLFYPTAGVADITVVDNRRNRAVRFLKEIGLLESIEKDRAHFLTKEITGINLDVGDEVKLMNLLDMTRFDDFGWLLSTTFARLEERSTFLKNAISVSISNRAQEAISVLQTLNSRNFNMFIRFVGEPDNYFIPWVITNAGAAAARCQSESIKNRINHLVVKNVISDKDNTDLSKAIDSLKRNEDINNSLNRILDLLAFNVVDVKDDLLNTIVKYVDRKEYFNFTALFILLLCGDKGKQILRNYLLNNPRESAFEFLNYLSVLNPEFLDNDIIALLRRNIHSRTAAKCIANLGEKGMPYIKDALLNDNFGDKQGACSALAHISSYKDSNLIPDDFIPLLIHNIELDFSAMVLGRMGKRVLPYLKEVLIRGDKNKRESIYEAYYYFSEENANEIPDDLIPIFIRNLATFRVSDILGNIGQRALPYLKRTLTDNDVFVRMGACSALQSFSYIHADAIPDDFIPLLINNLTLNSRYNTSNINITLANMGPRIFPYLRDMLVNGNMNVRHIAHIVLWCYKDKNADEIPNDFIPLIINNLKDDDASYISDIIKYIGSRTLPYLKQALNNPDRFIAKRAADFIKYFYESGF